MFPGMGVGGLSPFERSVAYAALPTVSTAGSSATFSGVATTNSGTLVADEWKPIVSVSGAGLFSSAGVLFNGTDTTTLSCRVKIDGLTIYEGSVTASTNNALAGVNFETTATAVYVPSSLVLPFLSSLIIEVKRTSTTAMTVAFAYTVSK